jgi:hypothetical protein
MRSGKCEPINAQPANAYRMSTDHKGWGKVAAALSKQTKFPDQYSYLGSRGSDHTFSHLPSGKKMNVKADV